MSQETSGSLRPSLAKVPRVLSPLQTHHRADPFLFHLRKSSATVDQAAPWAHSLPSAVPLHRRFFSGPRVESKSSAPCRSGILRLVTAQLCPPATRSFRTPPLGIHEQPGYKPPPTRLARFQSLQLSFRRPACSSFRYFCLSRTTARTALAKP